MLDSRNTSRQKLQVMFQVNKKLSYRQETARCVVSIEILRNSAETTYTTSPDQIDGMKLEI